jgi:hypothetical protein
MRRNATLTGALVCVAAVILALIGTAAMAGNGISRGLDGKVRAGGAEIRDHVAIQPQGFAETLAIGDTNPTCAEAEELIPLIEQGAEDVHDFSVSVTGRSFSGAGNLDDWYKYTTHGDCPSGNHNLNVEVSADKAQIEVEIYDACAGWPVATSMQATIFSDDMNSATETYAFSGLHKDVGCLVESLHTYYIHVNYLRPPDEGGSIKYDMTISEFCQQPPA